MITIRVNSVTHHQGGEITAALTKEFLAQQAADHMNNVDVFRLTLIRAMFRMLKASGDWDGIDSATQFALDMGDNLDDFKFVRLENEDPFANPPQTKQVYLRHLTDEEVAFMKPLCLIYKDECDILNKPPAGNGIEPEEVSDEPAVE